MTELADLSETDASNTTITGADIAENCAPSGINNAIRNLAGLIKRAFNTTNFRVRDATDQTKLLALNLSGFTTATTRTITVPNGSGTMALLENTQTFSGVKTFSSNPVMSGGGVQFPATQVASADPNTIDDYDEGTYTPILSGSSTAGSGTYGAQVGRYTKIGDVVVFLLQLTWSAHTGTGNGQFGALPFAAQASADTPVAVVASSYTFSGQLTARVNAGTTTVVLISMASGSAITNVTLDTSASVFFQGSYFV